MKPFVSNRADASTNLTLAHIVIGGALVFVASDLTFAMNLRLLPGLIAGAGCLGAAVVIVRTARYDRFLSTPLDLQYLGLCMSTSFTLCLLAGQGHIFYAAEDWLIRDAVLADLSVSALPGYAWNGETWVLRAPLGMYLLPGALGRVAGLGAAHTLMFVQNAALTGCALYLIAEAFQRRTLGFLVIFVLFSGLDFLGQLKTYGPQWFVLYPEMWHPFFAYLSFVSQIFWAPNHALPGWFFAALLALHLRGGGLAPILLVFFAAALLWSPLTMMGALPFVIFLVLREPKMILSPEIVGACLAGAAFLPIAIYLQTDAAGITSNWMPGAEDFPSFYLLFLGLEIPHVVLVVAPAFLTQGPWRGALILAIFLLCGIPFYRLGEYNDFAMRASIVPLTILAACFAWRVLELGELRDPLRFVAWAIIVIGAWSPAMEILRNLRLPAFAISSCDLVSSWREVATARSAKGDGDQYMAHIDGMPGWLLAPPQALRPGLREGASCWPDHPFARRPPAAALQGVHFETRPGPRVGA